MWSVPIVMEQLFNASKSKALFGMGQLLQTPSSELLSIMVLRVLLSLMILSCGHSPSVMCWFL